MKYRHFRLLMRALILLGASSALFYVGASASPYGYGAYGSCEYQACSISMTTSGTINLGVTPTDLGVYTISDDAVEVTTNSSRGYTLLLSSDSATENSLVAGSEAIDSTEGTTEEPEMLGVNQWGFRVDGFDEFGAGPTSAVTNVFSSSLTFAGIPLSGAPTMIRATDEAASEGEVTRVWYGVHADSSLPAGTYSATVIYTATMNP